MRCCTTDHDICLIRGNSFAQDIALVSGFDEVIATPGEYEGKMYFRLEQDDALPVIVELTAAPEVGEEPSVHGRTVPAALLSFTMTPAQTVQIPNYDIVYAITVRSAEGDFAKTVVQGKVKVTSDGSLSRQAPPPPTPTSTDYVAIYEDNK